ncbi:hypothetical protein CBM2605_A60084 [Cupriavidus neocaledonicus]|uniref:Uncharacterized protein n=2 Tax=Cupriavidus TaxID=106589 RepID=A0A375J110_9BURK|nr:hypothetical protein CBM2605_A60084 [Cupriavidus neocaledonicus]SPR98827.1 hypothetical protein CBM2634_A50045 [Cupriavidus taiwanensis]
MKTGRIRGPSSFGRTGLQLQT